MHDELHPLRGADPVHVAAFPVQARFQHLDHEHLVALYPDTWVFQVRWQHPVPRSLDRFALPPAAMTFEAETCWYTLHDMGPDVFTRPWEVLREGIWMPMEGIEKRQVAVDD